MTSATTSSNDKAIRILPFDGTSSGWHMWSRRFRAKCKSLEVNSILDGKQTIAADDKPNLTAEEIQGRKDNDNLYVELPVFRLAWI